MKLILVIFIVLVSYTVARRNKYEWRAEKSWSSCDKTCGIGKHFILQKCVKSTSYRTTEYTYPRKCSKVRKQEKVKTCSNGPCPSTKTPITFVWRTSKWSNCTHKCGVINNYRSRNVDCVAISHKMQNGKMELVSRPAKLSQCKSNLEPPRFMKCLELSCPPQWKIGKWSVCPISTKCDKPTQRRDLTCITKMPGGKTKKLRIFKCKNRPRVWQFCITESNLKLCSEQHNNQHLKQILKLKYDIQEDNSKIYQMRKANKLKITVGQTAHVFSGSRLLLVCPVEEFPMAYIEWEHNGKVYRYSPGGTALGSWWDKKKNRQPTKQDRLIKVYRGGKLRIRRFNINLHEGKWTCRAGKSEASLTLRHEMMSKGYSNWLNRQVGSKLQKRKSNQNKGMFNEQADKGGNIIGFIKPGTTAWKMSSWTKCPDPCLNATSNDTKVIRYKYRTVSCEQVQTKFFKVIPDWNCGSSKPRHMRKCPVPDSCPSWVVQKSPQDTCTDKCIGIGTAMTTAKLVCKDNGKVVSDLLCRLLPKPRVECPNKACQVKYLIGRWSQCSLSCSNTTSFGYISRTLRCVWQNDIHASAGLLCRNTNIKKPNVISKCSVPKCILVCRDLSPACKSQPRSRCNNTLFLHLCCSFCHSNKDNKKLT